MARPHINSTGLSVLWDPEKPAMDIVFVHGLQGHPFKTWAYPSPNVHSDTIPNPTPSKDQKKGRVVKRAYSFFRRKSVRNGRGAKNEHGTKDAKTMPDDLSETQQLVFWPYDLLPAVCKEARILTWGYDTQITKYYREPTSKTNVFVLGKSLLWELARNRARDRPIVFVAHSLGGIVIKQMLELSHESEEALYRNIALSTKAVVFLGTPHRGSKDMASLGESLRKVASLLMMDTSPAMLDALGLKTSDLERCQDSFMRLWRQLSFRVKTFQEGRGLTSVDIGIFNEKVVPDISSALGDPREHAEPLDANHMDMARVVGGCDPNYRKISGELGLIYQSVLDEHKALLDSGTDAIAMDAHAAEHTQRQATTTTDELICMNSLRFPGLRGRQNLVAPPTGTTCQWLETHQVYEAWLQRSSVDACNGLLWITGKPGSGKSTIMKSALEKCKSAQHPNKIIVSFFFDVKGPELTRSTVGFLRSVTYQIISQNAQLEALFIDLFLEDALHGSAGTGQCPPLFHHTEPDISWTKEQLQSFLYRVFRQKQTSNVSFVMFVDALDECDSHDGSEVAYLLRSLTKTAYTSGTILDICISSRYFGSITVGDCARINMEQCNRQDIEQCVLEMFATADMAVDSSNPWGQLCSRIVDKSSGVFLWAKLVVEALRREREAGTSSDTLESRLKEVPGRLEEVFRDLLREYSTASPSERLIVTRMFQWAIFSFRPLRLKHWHHILAFIKTTERTERASLKSLGLASAASEIEHAEISGDGTQKNIRKQRLEDGDDSLERQIRFRSKGLIGVFSTSESLDEVVPLKPMDDRRSSLNANAGSVTSELGETRLVELMHESVREFMLQKGGFALIDETLPSNAPLRSHVFILNMCLDYINVIELDDWIRAKQESWPQLVQLEGGSQQFRAKECSATSSLLKKGGRPTRHGSVNSFSSAASAEYDRSSADTLDSDSTFYSQGGTSSDNFHDSELGRRPRSFSTPSVRGSSPTRHPIPMPSRSTSEPPAPKSELPTSSRVASMINSESLQVELKSETRNGDKTSAWVPPLTEQFQHVEGDFMDYRPTQQLDFDMSFYFYAKNMVFKHVYAATGLGTDPGPIIDRLIASKGRLWRRWVYLQEEALHPKTTLVDFLLDHMHPDSYHVWMKSFTTTTPSRLTYFLLCLEMNSVTAQLAIRHDVEHALEWDEHPIILKALLENWNMDDWSESVMSECFGTYLAHLDDLVIYEKITSHAWNSCITKADENGNRLIDLAPKDGKLRVDLLLKMGTIEVRSFRSTINPCLLDEEADGTRRHCKDNLPVLVDVSAPHKNATSLAINFWGFWPASVAVD